MVILCINPDNPQERLLRQAVELLRQGAIICYPTDTVYGMGCDLNNHKAVQRLHELKRRPKERPFSFICSSLKHVSTYCHVSNHGYRLMKRLLPGPYTFVLPAMKIVPKIMMTKQKTVGIRVPDNRICNALVELLGNPIVTTSATCQSDESLPADAFTVEEHLGHLVDAIIDAGPLLPALSTMVSLVGEEPVVLRQGKGDSSQLF
jgi:tRNA threonylcarbamoyl adenosine modification protein (Sua5/YciO/YrdC/YwlC family)